LQIEGPARAHGRGLLSAADAAAGDSPHQARLPNVANRQYF
jgi:hypothetical protein